jgi:hypothetical protein
MAVALTAPHLSSLHSVTVIHFLSDLRVLQLVVKGRPPAPTVILSLRVE